MCYSSREPEFGFQHPYQTLITAYNTNYKESDAFPNFLEHCNQMVYAQDTNTKVKIFVKKCRFIM